MMKPALTGLKKIIEPCIKSCKRLPEHMKTFKKEIKKLATDKTTGKKLTNLIAIIAERWKTLGITLACILTLYYGIGATVSSNINNSLEAELKKSPQSSYVVAALAHTLKTQVDDSPWVPALPIIFPAAILDNLPNFQIGVKDGVRYFTKKLAILYTDENLKEAASLLDYPADIWLFSQTDDDRFAPGSAKQYRKALVAISTFTQKVSPDDPARMHELNYMLTALDRLLQRQIDRLSKQVQEHNAEISDFQADNLFYYAKGTIYTSYYFLSALAKDYQNVIVQTEQYEHITGALKHLKDAELLSPITIQNGSPEESYTANHLLYLAYHLLLAQNQINKIRYAIKY